MMESWKMLPTGHRTGTVLSLRILLQTRMHDPGLHEI